MLAKSAVSKLNLSDSSASHIRLTTEEQKAAKRIAELIVVKRAIADWSQEDLANNANMCKPYSRLNQQRVSSIENGSYPSFLELTAIASAFGCLVTDFEV